MKFSTLLVAIFIFFKLSSFSCTNFLITKGASTDGSSMITYSADSHTLYGELYHWPSTDYPVGSLLDIYEWDTGKFLGKIKQANHTFNVVGNMNEYQVAIGETTYGGRPELADSTAIMDYGSLMYIALQRAKTAREAISIMTSLVEEYGYFSSGESFSISDPNEVWIMEMISKGIELKTIGKGAKKQIVNNNKGAVWVAMKIPDGYISGHANQSRISTFSLNDTENCIYASDVISFAKSKGYFKGNDAEFSFCDAYAPLDFGAARFCESRVYAAFNRVNAEMGKYLDYAMGENLHNRLPLWIKPDKKLSVKDVMELMRDHFEGTPMDMTKDNGAGPYQNPYRWRPLTWKVDSTTYFNERAVSTQQTGFSFVTQSRSWLPSKIGGIIWFGVDDTYSTVYTPIYSSITQVPESYAVGNGKMMNFSDNSAFWVFNQVSNFAYTRYSDMIPEIRKKQAELENKHIQYVTAIDQGAMLFMKNNDEKLAVQFLTDFSVNNANSLVNDWKELYKYLFTKYMDGNIKEKDGKNLNPKVNQPGYGQDWYRMIIDQTGKKFEYKGDAGH